MKRKREGEKNYIYIEHKHIKATSEKSSFADTYLNHFMMALTKQNNCKRNFICEIF